MTMLDRQAIIVSLTPGVLFLIVAIVAKFLEVDLAEAIFQFGALIAVVGGGSVAWKNVYSAQSVDRISDEKHRAGALAGAAAEADERDRIEAEHAELWQQYETMAADDEAFPEFKDPFEF